MHDYRVTFYIGGAVPVTADMRCGTDDEAIRCAEAIGSMNGYPVALFQSARLIRAWPREDVFTGLRRFEPRPLGKRSTVQR
jgi:hypothetical protein